jgi:hypothetical protein
MVVPVLLLTLGAAAVLFGSRRRGARRHPVAASAAASSPVAYQHLQLYHGGLVSRDALDAARLELEELLEAGGPRAAEACLRPGLDYVIKVRALAEIGTEDAGRALECQLARRLAADPVEQAWYWVDLVQALRGLNRNEALPALLGCAERALESPLGHLYAAEVAAFPHFADYLLEPLTPAGRKCLHVLRKVMEGVRRGFVPVGAYAEAQIGEAVRRLAEGCPDRADPLLARVFLEALRGARRSYATAPELHDDPLRKQAVRWQAGQLRDAEPVLREYLHDIGEDLARLLPRAAPREQAEILSVIAEVRADAGATLLDVLRDRRLACRPAAVACLQWSPRPEAAAFLRGLARSTAAGKPSWWKRRAVGSAAPELLAALHALRGHAGEETETLLGEFARHPRAEFRAAALRGLGWWEPVRRAPVLNLLHEARLDGAAEVRMAATGALARLGECAALQVLREALSAENTEAVHQTIEMIAAEGLTWLWPDLDLLTEADDPAIAGHAWEAVEALRESVFGPLA